MDVADAAVDVEELPLTVLDDDADDAPMYSAIFCSRAIATSFCKHCTPTHTRKHASTSSNTATTVTTRAQGTRTQERSNGQTYSAEHERGFLARDQARRAPVLDLDLELAGPDRCTARPPTTRTTTKA